MSRPKGSDANDFTITGISNQALKSEDGETTLATTVTVEADGKITITPGEETSGIAEGTYYAAWYDNAAKKDFVVSVTFTEVFWGEFPLVSGVTAITIAAYNQTFESAAAAIDGSDKLKINVTNAIDQYAAAYRFTENDFAMIKGAVATISDVGTGGQCTITISGSWDTGVSDDSDMTSNDFMISYAYLHLQAAKDIGVASVAEGDFDGAVLDTTSSALSWD